MEEPIIEMIFHLKDGTSLSVSANEKTVYKMGWHMLLRAITGKFLSTYQKKISEGIFFFHDLHENI
ncbi:MAG TPA: hypothetical protein GXX65_07745 [Methanosarcina sp.]|nr:hypothetical protein [Methanosarcina sp.]